MWTSTSGAERSSLCSDRTAPARPRRSTSSRRSSSRTAAARASAASTPQSQADRVRETISLTGQFAAVDVILTGRENLVLIARLRAVPEPAKVADRLLRQFGLTDAADKRVGTYSGGMARRLDIAMSLVGTPAVIFLDEPTTGLDPEGRLEVWKTIKELAGGGTTILLTTQYLDEAEQLADRIAILHGGSIIAERDPRRTQADFSRPRKSNTSKSNRRWRRSSSPSSARRRTKYRDENCPEHGRPVRTIHATHSAQPGHDHHRGDHADHAHAAVRLRVRRRDQRRHRQLRELHAARHPPDRHRQRHLLHRHPDLHRHAERDHRTPPLQCPWRAHRCCGATC